MRPPAPGRETIDPREYLSLGGEASVATALRDRTGYCIQRQTLAALSEALESGTPLLAEGKPGCGKSALANAVAAAFNLPYFSLQSMDGISLGDLLYEWDRAGQAVAGPEARWTREYLMLGEILGAFEHAERRGVCILRIDEVDKLTERHQHMLLQILEEGFSDVPRLVPTSRVGITTPGRAWPIVILTSNDRGDVISEPLRSRCTYTWIHNPTPVEEAEILVSRCPQARPELIYAAVRLLAFVRHKGDLRAKPGLREVIRLTRELARKGIKRITPDVVERHACHLVKNRNDLASLVAARAAVAVAAHRENQIVDEPVRRAIEGTARGHAA